MIVSDRWSLASPINNSRLALISPVDRSPLNHTRVVISPISRVPEASIIASSIACLIISSWAFSRYAARASSVRRGSSAVARSFRMRSAMSAMGSILTDGGSHLDQFLNDRVRDVADVSHDDRFSLTIIIVAHVHEDRDQVLVHEDRVCGQVPEGEGESVVCHGCILPYREVRTQQVRTAGLGEKSGAVAGRDCLPARRTGGRGQGVTVVGVVDSLTTGLRGFRSREVANAVDDLDVTRELFPLGLRVVTEVLRRVHIQNDVLEFSRVDSPHAGAARV